MTAFISALEITLRWAWKKFDANVLDWFRYIAEEVYNPDKDHSGFDDLILFGPDAIPESSNLKRSSKSGSYAARTRRKTTS